jgi:hypothetical protein
MSKGSTSSTETGPMLKTNLAHQDKWLLNSPWNFPTQHKQFCCKKLDCTRKIQLIICYFSSWETLEHTNRLGSEWNLKLSLVSIIEKMAWRVVRSLGKNFPVQNLSNTHQLAESATSPLSWVWDSWINLCKSQWIYCIVQQQPKSNWKPEITVVVTQLPG